MGLDFLNAEGVCDIEPLSTMADLPPVTDLTSIVSTVAAPPYVLPIPFNNINPRPLLITQGAEALVFRTHFLTPSHPCALKYRPAKPWRHPTLDIRLTRHRVLSEARILLKCRREGVKVPGVLSLDWEGGPVDGTDGRKSGGWMMMEWIEGDTVRNLLSSWLRIERSSATVEVEHAGQSTHKSREGPTDLMMRIGRVVGRMHAIGIVHGDLTTSNLMLRPAASSPTASNGAYTSQLPGPSLEGEVVLIDFGLAAQSLQDEDKAVDLYVLEKAFGSTHPTAEDLFQEVLNAYRTSYKGAQAVLKRLEDVRMRGRKRSMLG